MPSAPRAALTALTAVLLLVGPAQGNHSAKTCFGKTATISDHRGVIEGTSGHDVIIGDSAANRIYGKGGNDRICSGGEEDRVEGGKGNDMIDGGAGSDTWVGPQEETPKSPGLHGNEGKDLIKGGTGNDGLRGGRGNDELRSGRGFDYIFDGPGDDVAFGGPASDGLIMSGSGDDRAFGQEGGDQVVTFDGVNGNDVANGGPNPAGSDDHCIIDDDGANADATSGCEVVEPGSED